MASPLEKWLLSMITIFRREYNKLTENEQECISPPDDFTRHLQIEIIQFKNPVGDARPSRLKLKGIDTSLW